MLDRSLLRGRIKRELGSEKRFGEVMDLSSTTITKKLNSEREFTEKEIIRACSILHIELSEAYRYFFAIAVR